MVQNFDRARRIAGPKAHVLAVNGCCYGKDTSPAKTGNYIKLCGQDFWHLISGEPLLYQKIIEPLGFEARKRNDAFDKAFARLHPQLTAQQKTQVPSADSGYRVMSARRSHHSAAVGFGGERESVRM